MALAERWLKRIDQERSAHDKFRRDGEDAIRHYRNEKKNRFNIFFSNTEILRGTTFPFVPKPSVRRRFLDRDPLAREIARVTERALEFCNDDYDFESQADLANLDWLIAGMGQVRLHYDASFSRTEEGEDADITYQSVWVEHVPWKEFGWQPVAKWSQVKWTYIRHLMDKQDIEDNFPDMEGNISDVPFDHKIDGDERSEESFAEVYEIFDKKDRKFLAVARGFPGMLRNEDDPYGLVEFFPHPKPLFGIQTSDKIDPVPELEQYKELVKQLQRITQRLDLLTEALKNRGIYDAAFPELQNIMTAGDNKLLPVNNFQARFGDKGLESVLALMPLAEIAGVIAQLEDRKARIKADIFELTGISDIVRGASKASETLGAQQIKSQGFNLRTQKKRRRMDQFLKEIYRLKAEIISDHFEPQVLTAITGVPVAPQMIEVMRSDDSRAFVVDVETESTDDTAEEQKNRIEFLDGAVTLLERLAPGVQAGIITPDLAKQMLLFGSRPFRAARQLEDAIEQMVFPPQQQGQDPEMMERIGAMNAKLQEMQAEGQLKVQKQQFEMQLAQAKLQAELQLKQRQVEGEMQLKAKVEELEIQIKQFVAQQDVELDRAKAAADIELERDKAEGTLTIERAKGIDEVALRREQKLMEEQSAERERGEEEAETAKRDESSQALLAKIDELTESVSRERQIVRDGQGKIVGLR